jgi:hypothetical protein
MLPEAAAIALPAAHLEKSPTQKQNPWSGKPDQRHKQNNLPR